MARTDYIQPDPIKPLPKYLGLNKDNINSAVNTVVGDRSKPFGSMSGGRDASAQNNQDNLNRIHQAGGLIGLGRNIGNKVAEIGDGINEKIINPVIDAGGRALFGKDYNNLGGSPAIDSPAQPASNPQQVNDPSLGSAIQNTPASLEAPGTNQTSHYRDATIGDGGNSVSFDGGNSSVSGLDKEQAARVQQSLALGQQVSGFNMGNMIDATRSDADGKIMQAMRDGDINADKASALMNRDFRASDRIDRLGGNADTYIEPSAEPTNIQEAMAYGQNLDNFTRNGELSTEQALLAQRTYMGSLGGYKGVANAKDKSSFNALKLIDSQGNETPYVYNEQTGQQANAQQQESPNDLFNRVMSSKTEKTKNLGIAKFEKLHGPGSFEKYMKGLGS